MLKQRYNERNKALMHVVSKLGIAYSGSSPEDNPAFESILTHATSIFESKQKEYALQVEQTKSEERNCAETIQRLSTRIGTLKSHER